MNEDKNGPALRTYLGAGVVEALLEATPSEATMPRWLGKMQLEHSPGSALALKEGMLEWLESIPWDTFATVTFVPPNEMVNTGYTMVGVKGAWRRWRTLVMHWGILAKGDIQWFASMERHKSGAPHIHAVVVGLSTATLRHQAWEGATHVCGWSSLRGFKGVTATEYVLKYTTKDNSEWRCSDGLAKQA